MLAAGSAMAADGTINFTGSITDQTCTVDSGSQNLNVNLGKVAQTALNGAAGMKAAPTRFTLSLSDCPDTVTGANVKFDGTSDGVNQNLLALDNGTGIATGVGIEIADKNGTAIPLHTASPDYTSPQGPTHWTLLPVMSLPAQPSPPVQQTAPRSSPLTTNNTVPSRGAFSSSYPCAAA